MAKPEIIGLGLPPRAGRDAWESYSDWGDRLSQAWSSRDGWRSGQSAASTASSTLSILRNSSGSDHLATAESGSSIL